MWRKLSTCINVSHMKYFYIQRRHMWNRFIYLSFSHLFTYESKWVQRFANFHKIFTIIYENINKGIIRLESVAKNGIIKSLEVWVVKLRPTKSKIVDFWFWMFLQISRNTFLTWDFPHAVLVVLKRINGSNTDFGSHMSKNWKKELGSIHVKIRRKIYIQWSIVFHKFSETHKESWHGIWFHSYFGPSKED